MMADLTAGLRAGRRMMMKTGLFGAIALALIATSHGTLAQTPIPPSPKDFVMATTQSEEYEIMSAQIADVEAKDSRVRSFAQEMVRDHTRLNENVRHAAMTAGLPAPNRGMSSDQAMLLSSLQSLRGAEFDRAYVRQQVLAHEQGLAVLKSFSTEGTEPNLRKSAQSVLPMIRDHLKKAEQLRSDIEKP